jgi:hypothetical protein
MSLDFLLLLTRDRSLSRATVLSHCDGKFALFTVSTGDRETKLTFSDNSRTRFGQLVFRSHILSFAAIPNPEYPWGIRPCVALCHQS